MCLWHNYNYSRSYAEDVTSVTSGASQGPHSFNLVFVCLCVCVFVSRLALSVVVVVVVVVVFFYFPSEASTVMNTTLKRADNRVEGCGVRKKIIIIRDMINCALITTAKNEESQVP